MKTIIFAFCSLVFVGSIASLPAVIKWENKQIASRDSLKNDSILRWKAFNACIDTLPTDYTCEYCWELYMENNDSNK